MVAYRKIDEASPPSGRRVALSHELFHGLTPEQFNDEAQSLADAQAMTPAVRRRLDAQLTERLMTPPDAPSWGPDWVKHGDKFAPKRGKAQAGLLARVFGKGDDEAGDGADAPEAATDEDYVIARNMEKSRQIAHYKWLYVGAVVVALVIALAAMFVDYQIIRGDIWTRALSNEFMVVPAALQSTVIFKSLQVIFAVLIVHFMLKITGVYGRNVLVTTAFVFALVMIGGLGYLVAYNNMSGGTSTTLEHQQTSPQNNSIDKLFASTDNSSIDAAAAQPVADTQPTKPGGFSLFNLPRLSQTSLANTDSWFWLAFASVIFFIVTSVAALYLQGTENNIRNVSLARDYKHRQRQFAQLHLLQLADRGQS